MNQDSVKEILDKYTEDKDFTVIFTGKQKSGVDGLYNQETKEILIHNKNFKSDNALLYTAFHKLAHHIDLKANPKKKGQRKHTQAFYAILNGLIDKAIENKDYEEFQAEELDQAIAKGIEHTKFLKQFGKILIALYQKCIKEHFDFEDLAFRKLCMKKHEVKSIMSMWALNIPEDLTGDLARSITKIKDKDERKEALEKKAIPPAKAPEIKDEEVYLREEQKRLDKQIEKLLNRKEEVELLLEEMGR